MRNKIGVPFEMDESINPWECKVIHTDDEPRVGEVSKLIPHNTEAFIMK